MLLDPCRLSTADFDSSEASKRLLAEASDLGFRAGQVPGGQLYDDACDTGITLVSHKTGVVTHWFRTEDKVSGGEVVAWVYKPTFETLHKCVHLAGWEVHILND